MSLDGKWIQDVSADQPVSEFARRVLQSRLAAVWHWLPLAAQRSEEDVEHVHQLRVAVRRAVAVLRMFRKLIPNTLYNGSRERLCEMRRSADGARNWDVFADYLSQSKRCASQIACEQILAGVKARRVESQQQIVSMHRRAVEDSFEQQAAELIKQVRFSPKRPDQAEPTLGRRATKYLRRMAKRFWLAAEADLSETAALHALRICGKKLRYSIEILAPAFGRGFRTKLYRRVEQIQERLGQINDHVTALANLGPWMAMSKDSGEKRCLSELISIEEAALDESRAAFYDWWTPRRIEKLKRRLKKYL
jgi:CHAD domain-containing protein